MRLSPFLFSASLAVLPAAARPANGPPPNSPTPVFATTTPPLPAIPTLPPDPKNPPPEIPEKKGRKLSTQDFDRRLWDTLMHYGAFTTTAIRGQCWPAPNGTTGLTYLDTSWGMQAGVFSDPRSEEVIISFPGTFEWWDTFKNLNVGYFDWITDLDGLGSNWDTDGIKCGEECRIHQGFWNGWKDVKEDVMKAVDGELKNKNWNKVVVTGHSMGGAIGTLAFGDLRANGYDARAYVSANPPAGNNHTAMYIEKLSDEPDDTKLGRYLRITAGNDNKPVLGPLQDLGFTHPRTEIWLGPSYEPHQSANNTFRCYGQESQACIAGAGPHSGDTHSEYAFVSDDYYCDDGKPVIWEE